MAFWRLPPAFTVMVRPPLDALTRLVESVTLGSCGWLLTGLAEMASVGPTRGDSTGAVRGSSAEQAAWVARAASASARVRAGGGVSARDDNARRERIDPPSVSRRPDWRSAHDLVHASP